MALSAPCFSGRTTQPPAAPHAWPRHTQPLLRHPCRSRRRRQFLSAKPCAVVAAPTSAPAQTNLGLGVWQDFPILDQEVNGKPLVYLDNAATSQKPRQVLDAMDQYYLHQNSNVHRGVHFLSNLATQAYEDARDKVAAFVGAGSSREIVFTRNATEALNLVANTWGTRNIQAGDEIILSEAEHHGNLVPWQMLAQRTGAVLRHVGLTATQEVDVEAVKAAIGPKTKLVSLVHVSNMLGAILPTVDIVSAAHEVGAKVLLDCCQSVPNMPVNVQTLGADWIVASSHKMCGPTGIGFLWGRPEILAGMPPWMGGGEMIQDVFLDHATYAEPPMRFEAGTPAIAEAIGLGAACDYLSHIGMDVIQEYEREMGTYLYEQLSQVEGIIIYGPPPSRGRAALTSFNVEGVHANDISTLLDTSGVAVRSGHHCTQPLHRHLGVSASTRASLYIYSNRSDVDRFIVALRETTEFFASVNV